MTEGFTIHVLELPEMTAQDRQAQIDQMLATLPLGARFALHSGAGYVAELERNRRDAGQLAQLRALVREDR